MTLKSVVLPAPFGPMMPWMAPSATVRLTSSTALRPPKARTTPSSTSSGRPDAGARAAGTAAVVPPAATGSRGEAGTPSALRRAAKRSRMRQ